MDELKTIPHMLLWLVVVAIGLMIITVVLGIAAHNLWGYFLWGWNHA